MTDKAIKERGGMNISPWEPNTRRRHVGFEEWFIIAEYVNTIFDILGVSADIDTNMANRPYRIRTLVFGRVDLDNMRKTLEHKIAKYYDKRLGRYTKRTTFEHLWRPENYTMATKWWEEKMKEIKNFW